MVPLSSETSLFEVFGDPGGPFFSFEGSRGLLGGSRGGSLGRNRFQNWPLGAPWGALGAKPVDFGEENRVTFSHMAPERVPELILELF